MNGRRVFVLGSGFSAAMGLPTLADLFKHVMSAKPQRESDDKNQVLNALESLYPHSKSGGAPTAYPPFEEFLSLVTAAKEFVHDDRDWGQVEISALRLLTDFLDVQSKSALDSHSLDAFVDRLTPRDVIITFNWDYLVERRLRDHREIESNLLARDGERIAILKLHGSIGWCRIPQEEPVAPDTAVEIRDRVFRLPDHAYYDLWGLKNWPPLIVPPTQFKRPEVDSFLNPIWCEAFNALVEADFICIIGYSLPPDDFQARALFSSGLALRSKRQREQGRNPGKYLLIDPNPEVAKKYFSLIAENLDFRLARFEDAVDSIFS